MSEITKTCRLCGDTSDPETDNIFLNFNQSLPALILKYLSIKITVDDPLPRNTCYACKSALISFDEFALKCNAVQIRLSPIAEQFVPQWDVALEAVKLEYVPDCEDPLPIDSRDPVKSEKGSDASDNNFLSDDSYDSKPILPLKRKTRKKSTKSSKKHKVHSNKKTKEETKNDPENIKSEELSPDVKPNARRAKSDTLFNSFIDLICHLCPEKFSTWSALRRHTHQAHATTPLITCVCNKELTSKGSLYVHILKHDRSAGFRCEICDKCYLSEKYYKLHLSSHKSKVVKTYDCSECDKTFPNSLKLKNHEKLHKPLENRLIHPCDICGSKFSSKNYVELHIRSIHNKEKSHICDICGMAFSTKGALKGHSNKHSEERPFHCPFCPKRFKSKPPFKSHLEYHNGAQYKCEKCPSVFNFKSTLREHMYVHKDIYRYICNVCNKGFKWKSSFQTHMNNHTGNTPYSCPWCPKIFRDGPNFRIHKRRCHPVELSTHEAIKSDKYSPANNSKKSTGPPGVPRSS